MKCNYYVQSIFITNRRHSSVKHWNRPFLLSFCDDEELLISNGIQMSDYVFNVLVAKVKLALMLGLEIREQASHRLNF